MPQIFVRYNLKHLLPDQLVKVAEPLRKLVAEAASCGSTNLTIDDVDWLPQVNENGAFAANFSIELKMIGYPERKEKLTRDVVLKLKQDMWEAGLQKFVSVTEPFLWVQFVDPDGVHV